MVLARFLMDNFFKSPTVPKTRLVHLMELSSNMETLHHVACRTQYRRDQMSWKLKDACGNSEMMWKIGGEHVSGFHRKQV